MDRECDHGNVNEPRSPDLQLKDRLLQREDAAGDCFGVISTRAQDPRRDAARALSLRAHVSIARLRQ
jgi:hypothetical protein